MITKEQFDAYEEVRRSGETNMFHSVNVIRLAKEMSGVSLSKSVVIEIMHNYKVLKERFENESDHIRCASCKKVDCLCYEDAVSI